MLTVNVAMYAWIFWLCIVFPRALSGKERVLVLGWVPGLLLSPVQGIVSVPLAVAIQYFKAVTILVAFIAAVIILVEGPSGGTTASDETAPQSLP